MMYESEIFTRFGFRWQLYLDDSETDRFYLRIRMIQIPRNVQAIHIKFVLFWEEKELKFAQYITMEQDKMHVSPCYDTSCIL